MERAQKRFEAWCSEPLLDSVLLKELQGIAGDAAQIDDCFYRDLEFGTGGLRGVLGAGTNRMNVHTVDRATRGLAQYLCAAFDAPRCAIAYDSRHKSAEFARVTAAALAAAGVRVFLYPELTPTPMLSFAVRYLHCAGGVVITASHNPAKYNGYKVYGPDGCQITLEAAAAVQKAIAAQPEFAPLASYDALAAAGQITLIGEEVQDAYFAAMQAASIEPPAAPLHIVYSPLNGTGNKPVRRMLEALGNITVTVVPQQEAPDGDFPTCPYPNPEIPEAMALASRLTEDVGADFFLATDPDCDRVGAGVPTADGVRLINGNEMGVLLLDYICRRRIALGAMPPRPVAVKTIVTTEMAAAVAKKYGVELRNVLTGFKFIGEQIGLLEAAGETGRYLFGFEESYGYLSATFVRDKDAVNAAMLICEMAAWHKSQGRSLPDALDAAYREYGCYKNGLLSFAFEGPTGMEKMRAILDGLRAARPAEFAGKAVTAMTDYLLDDTGLPKSNVLSLALSDGCHVVARPSGTEPKLKLYTTARAETAEAAEAALAALNAACTAFVEAQK